jgi:hypothetical protein
LAQNFRNYLFGSGFDRAFTQYPGEEESQGPVFAITEENDLFRIR